MPSGRYESRAEMVAAGLSRAHGTHALGRASKRRGEAEAAGNHRAADLYRAVCTIIADHGEVYSRSRARS